MTIGGNYLWLSTREIRRAGDPEWEGYIQFIGLPHLREVRSIDSWCNPGLGGNLPVSSLEELWECLEADGDSGPTDGSQYHLLFTDALGHHGSICHPRLKLLGYDLSDETWTSSLLNRGQWQGILEPIARRSGQNGLLSLEDAKLAQAVLPEAWRGDPHSFVTIWVLFEIVPEFAEKA